MASQLTWHAIVLVNIIIRDQGSHRGLGTARKCNNTPISENRAMQLCLKTSWNDYNQSEIRAAIFDMELLWKVTRDESLSLIFSFIQNIKIDWKINNWTTNTDNTLLTPLGLLFLLCTTKQQQTKHITRMTNNTEGAIRKSVSIYVCVKKLYTCNYMIHFYFTKSGDFIFSSSWKEEKETMQCRTKSMKKCTCSKCWLSNN